MRDCRGEYVK
jgi:hypothetical protein